jgi:predicted ATPase
MRLHKYINKYKLKIPTDVYGVGKGNSMDRQKGLKSRFIGREKTLENLRNRLDESIGNKGQMTLISGEAGVGKTRLLSELKRYAKLKSVRCLEGACIYHEVSDPYLPFIEALSDITSPQLVDDSKKYATIEEVFLINNAGNVVSYASRVGANILDEDIVGGMLAAVESFVKDAFGDEEGTPKGLETLVYGTTRILIEHGDLVFLAVVISGGEPEGLQQDLKELIQKIERKYHDLLSQWDGEVAKVEEISEIIRGLTNAKYKVRRAIKDIDIKKERGRVFERVLQLIIEASQKEPILLILEDIHWADVSSLQLLQYIARNTRNARVFMCATYRPEELDNIQDKKVHPLKEMIVRMSRDRMYISIELNCLEPEEVSFMLKSIFEMDEIPPDFSERIFKETEGNPFFIEEMLNSFQDDGIILAEEDGWQIKEVSKIDIPSTIIDLISLRVDRLDEGAINVIKQASVIGHSFDFNTLSNASGIAPDNILDTLEKLEQKKLIMVDSENDELYRFSHSMIREVIYNMQSSHRKRLIHEKIAKALEELNKDNLEDAFYQLAYHYSNTKDYDKVLDYSMKAGEKASGEFALDEALGFYRWALNAQEEMEENRNNIRTKLEIITHLGDIYYVIGEGEKAFEYYCIMERLSEELKDYNKKAEVYRNIGLLHINKNEWEEAVTYLYKAKKISERINDATITTDIYYLLGTVSELKGELDKARDYFGKCMEIAVDIKDESKIASAYLGLGRLNAQKSEYSESIQAFKNAIDILEKIQDLGELSKAYENLGATYIFVDLDEAIKYHNKTIEIATKTGDIRIKGYSLLNISYSYIKKNELKMASTYLEKALCIFEKLDERMLISMAYINYGTIYRLQKEWEKATEFFEKAISICKELDTPYYLGYGLSEFGIMWKDKGDTLKANEHLNSALDIFRNLQNNDMIKKIEKELNTL